MVNGDTCLTANIIQLCCQWLFICNACMMSQSPSLVMDGYYMEDTSRLVSTCLARLHLEVV